MARKRAKKTNIMDKLLSGLSLGAGGFAGSQLTGLIAKQIGNEQVAPMITAAIGIGGQMFVPSMADAFKGMVANGTAEALESLLSMATATTTTTKSAQGVSNTLGFVPQRMATGSNPTMFEKRPIRY